MQWNNKTKHVMMVHRTKTQFQIRCRIFNYGQKIGVHNRVILFRIEKTRRSSSFKSHHILVEVCVKSANFWEMNIVCLFVKISTPLLPNCRQRFALGRRVGDESTNCAALTGRLIETDTWTHLSRQLVGTERHHHHRHVEFTASSFGLPELAAHTNTFHVRC